MNKTRDCIVRAAIKVFSSEGYKGATMDEIAASAGVAKGTLYYNFNSKEEIFNYIVKLGIDHLRKSIDGTVNSNLSAVIKLRDICKIQLTFFYENKDFVKVIFSQIWGIDKRQNLLREAIKEYISDIQLVVEEGVKNKLIKNQDTSILAHLFFGSITSTAVYDLINDNKEELDVIIKTTLEFSLKGIGISLN